MLIRFLSITILIFAFYAKNVLAVTESEVKKLVGTFPKALVGSDPSFFVRKDPISSSVFVSFDSDRRESAINFFMSTLSHASELSASNKSSQAAFLLLKQKILSLGQGSYMSYGGVTFIYVEDSVKKRARDAFVDYAMIYDLESLRLLYASKLSNKVTDPLLVSSLLSSSVYFMVNGLDNFNALFRYSINNYLLTDGKKELLEAWTLRVAASHSNRLVGVDVSQLNFMGVINRYQSLQRPTPNVSDRKLDSLMLIFLDGMSKDLVSNYQSKIDSSNCFSLMVYLGSEHILNNLHKFSDSRKLCRVITAVRSGNLKRNDWEEFYYSAGSDNYNREDRSGLKMIFNDDYDVKIDGFYFER